MKSKIFAKLFAIMIFISLFQISSCTKENTTPLTYSTSDIQGIWTGDLRIVFYGGDNDGEVRTSTMTFIFNADGTLDTIEGHPAFLSNTGSLSVSQEGNLTGVITTTHDTNPGIETTSENWSGCVFKSKTKLNVNMRWNWTNTRPGIGYYTLQGELTK